MKHGLTENTKVECNSLDHPYCQYDDEDNMDCGRFEKYYIPFDYCFEDDFDFKGYFNVCKCKCRDSRCNINKYLNGTRETNCTLYGKGIVFEYSPGSVTPLLKEGDPEKRNFFRYMEENFNGRPSKGLFDDHGAESDKNYIGLFEGRKKGRPRKGTYPWYISNYPKVTFSVTRRAALFMPIRFMPTDSCPLIQAPSFHAEPYSCPVGLMHARTYSCPH